MMLFYPASYNPPFPFLCLWAVLFHIVSAAVVLPFNLKLLGHLLTLLLAILCKPKQLYNVVS